MRKIIFTSLALSVIIFPLTMKKVLANDALKAFRRVVEIEKPSLVVPTVLEVDLSNLKSDGLVVWDKTKEEFVPGKVFKKEKNRIILRAQDKDEQDRNNLVDNNLNTFVTFDTDGYSTAHSEIILNLYPATEIEGVKLILNRNVSLPNWVTIYDKTNNQTLVARKAVRDNFIYFPRTRTSQIDIRLEHIQPLQIAEIRVVGSQLYQFKRYLRFLAQPQSEYALYFDAAYNPQIQFSEFPDLSDNRDIKKANLGAMRDNELFQEPDSDKDGVIDKQDNCVSVSNPDQKDINHNGRGDACDDWDKDGVINSKDNCPNIPNRLQTDKDKDGKGDACDSEESRFTERNPWLIWAAVAIVVLMFIIMSVSVIKQKKTTD